MSFLKLLQAMSDSGLVFLHLSRHENKTVEPDTLAYYGNILHRLFKDDIEMAVVAGSISIAHPPKIQPVRIELKRK